jgi:hypothetical protein
MFFGQKMRRLAQFGETLIAEKMKYFNPFPMIQKHAIK